MLAVSASGKLNSQKRWCKLSSVIYCTNLNNTETITSEKCVFTKLRRRVNLELTVKWPPWCSVAHLQITTLITESWIYAFLYVINALRLTVWSRRKIWSGIFLIKTRITLSIECCWLSFPLKESFIADLLFSKCLFSQIVINYTNAAQSIGNKAPIFPQTIFIVFFCSCNLNRLLAVGEMKCLFTEKLLLTIETWWQKSRLKPVEHFHRIF